MSRYRTEYRPGNRHEERGGHTFAADITDTEEEFVVAEEEIKQVAAHRFGRCQRGIDLHIVTVVFSGEHLGQHTHLYAVGNAEVTLDGGILGGRPLQFLDILHERVLHITKRVTQLSYLIRTVEIRQRRFKLSRGDSLRLLRQTAQGVKFAGDDANKEIEHQQQTDTDNHNDGAVETRHIAEDVALGADDGHRTASMAEGLIEHQRFLSVDHHVLHALLTALHSMTQGGHRRVGMLNAFGKDRLVEHLRGVRMHEVSTATTDHHTVGVGIRLHGGDRLCQFVERDVGGDNTVEIPLIILERTAVRGDNLITKQVVGRHGSDINIGVGPTGPVEQFTHQIPIHVKVLIVVVSFLLGFDHTVVIR